MPIFSVERRTSTFKYCYVCSGDRVFAAAVKQVGKSLVTAHSFDLQ